MRLKGKHKLTRRLTRVVVLVALVIGVMLNLVQIFLDFVNEEKRADRILGQVVQASLPTAIEVAYKLDEEGAQELINGLLNYDFIEYAHMEDESGNILAEGNLVPDVESSTLWLTDILFPGKIERKTELKKQGADFSYGFLTLRANNDRIFSELYRRSLNLLISGIAKSLVLSLVLLGVFYALLTRPLLRIGSFFHTINPENDSGARLPLLAGHEDDEMGQIVHRANSYLENAEKHLLAIQTAQGEIEKRKEYLQNILTTTVEGFLRLDSQGIICDTNPSMCIILGLQENDIVGHKLIEFVEEENKDFLLSQQRMRREGKPSSYLINFVHNNGDIIPCGVNATPLLENNDTYSGAFAFVTDMRNVVAMEEEKEQLEKQLLQARKMESIGTLAGGIAHEFNNLLASIIGYAELSLMRKTEETPDREDLQVILQSALRGKELVKQILDFSRQSETSYSVSDAAKIVNEAVKILKSTLPVNIDMKVEIDEGAGFVRVDPVKMQQVVINLCTNSFHAMEETGGELTLSLSRCEDIHQLREKRELTQDRGFIRLTVRDTGEGIPADLQERVFDPFFTTKEVGRGTGMGLSIVHGIVEDFNGWVEIHSSEGKGCAMHVFLPLTEPAEAIESSDIVVTRGGGETVLVVDDEPHIVKLFSRCLEKLGYTVKTALDGKEGLAVFSKEPDAFDAVITDYAMPGLNGIELINKLRELRGEIPVILLTGYNSSISQDSVQQGQINGFSHKPIGVDELGLLLRRVLEGESVFMD